MTLALSFINRVLVTAVKHHHWTCRQRPRRWRQIQGKTAQSQRPVASQQPPLEFFIFFNFFCYFLYLFFTFPTNSLRTFSLPFPLYDPPPLKYFVYFLFPLKTSLGYFLYLWKCGKHIQGGQSEHWTMSIVDSVTLFNTLVKTLAQSDKMIEKHARLRKIDISSFLTLWRKCREEQKERGQKI